MSTLGKIKRSVTLTDLYDDLLLSVGSSDDITLASRKKKKVILRQIFCLIARKYTPYSLNDIGIFLGGRHHTTVMSSVRTAKTLISVNDQIFMEYWNTYLTKSILYKKLIPRF
jgi:hypothetical protein